MNVMVVDDEKSMLYIIKKMLQKIPQVEVSGIFISCKEAESFLKSHRIDLIFIDICMPEENGFEFAKHISNQYPNIKVVFLTAHKEYALDAFNICALDYIIKPVSKERLLKTINRAKEYIVNFDIGKQEIKGNKLFVYCLGGVDVYSPNGETVHFLSSKSEELFVYLLVNRSKTVNKWIIIEDIFADMPRGNAETYLNTTIYKLRKALQPYNLKEAIITLNGGYRIDTKEIFIDFIDLENQINAIITMENSNLEEFTNLEQIYVGELCEHKGYTWAHIEKERIFKTYWRFATQLSSQLINQGDYFTALKILKKLEHMNELDEEINLFLMYTYAKEKDRHALVNQYQKYKNNLKNELDIEPEQVTIKLYEKLIATFNGRGL